MWQFIKLLFASWFSKVLLLLGIASAIGIYVPRITLPTWVPTVILVSAVFFASYDVYRKQKREIGNLHAKLDSRRSELVIHPHKSRYIRHVALQGDFASPLGTYIELGIAIENKGNRNSVINRWDLKIDETGKEYKQVGLYGKGLIQGRKSQYSLPTTRNLVSGGYIRVPAESVAGPGVLPLYVRDILPESSQRIQCKLTLFDTEGNTCSKELRVPEA
jgi:hypothetical protein